MSEFTLDIQLTELGFSNWNFPLCEPQSVKDNFLPTQNATEKPAPEIETPTDSQEDACIGASSSADKSFLQDHQYYTPIKDNSSSNGETAQSNSKINSTDKKDKVICNSWKRGRRRREGIEQRNDDDEEQNGKEEMKNNDKEQKCSEVSQEASSLSIDDAVSGEERTDEDAELLTDDDDNDDEEEEVEEEEEDDVVEDKEEEYDDDDSWSGTLPFSKQWFDLVYKLFCRMCYLPYLRIRVLFCCLFLVEHGVSNAKIMGSIPRESKS